MELKKKQEEQKKKEEQERKKEEEKKLKEEENRKIEEEKLRKQKEEENKKIEEENLRKQEEEKKSVKVYEKGLSKSREGFVSKLANLTNKYKSITDDYFDELEEILIMADIGVNTVMDFIDRLKKRVKHENITDFEYLKEVNLFLNNN